MTNRNVKAAVALVIWLFSASVALVFAVITITKKERLFRHTVLMLYKARKEKIKKKNREDSVNIVLIYHLFHVAHLFHIDLLVLGLVFSLYTSYLGSHH